MFIVTILAVRTEWLTSLGIFASIVIIAPITFYMNQLGLRIEAAAIGFFVTPVLAVLISRIVGQRLDRFLK
jgi:hypothetical protein